ncbi:MAG: hypothetical protein AAGB05_00885 [Pseudomonadota bacterium]
MSDKGKDKTVPVPEVEKEFKALCGALDKELKANKLDMQVTKELRKCVENVQKKVMGEAKKNSTKEKTIDPMELKPILQKPPKDLFVPIRLVGAPGKDDAIKLHVGGKNLYLQGKIKIDTQKGKVYFEKGVMFYWKGAF